MKSTDVITRAAGKLTLSLRDSRANTLPPPPVIYSGNIRLLDLPAALPIKLILLALVLLLLPAGQAFAADFYVPRDCSLAAAITSANSNTASEACKAGDAGADTIHLTGNVNLGAHLTEITESLTINGRRRVISGQDMYRCLKVKRGGIALSLNDLIISNCKAVRNQSDTDGEPGGAIQYDIVSGQTAAGSLSLDRVTLRHSQTHTRSTTGGGAGLHAESRGGHLTVTINRSAIHNNTTTLFGGGGGLAFVSNITATITNTSIFDNYADQRGGGIYFEGRYGTSPSLTLNHVTITNNESTSEHGNLGGGLYFWHGTLVMHNTIIAGNISTTENGSNCRVRPQSLTFTDRSNNIAGTGSTNCPTISVDGTAVTDAKLAANPTNRAGTRYYDLTSGSAAVNRLTTCSVAVDQRGYPRPWAPGGACDIGAIEYGSRLPGGGGDGSGGDSSDDDDEESSASRTTGVSAKPAVSTCLTLPGIQVSGISQSTQCQRVDAVGIGNPGIGAGDFVDAIDVWSWVLPNTRICFEAAGGGIKFIDTAAMPRTIQDLTAYSLNGLTCATINSAGILVLLPGDAPPARNAASGSAPAASARSLSGCMVTLTENLNFRESPGGPLVIRDWIPNSWLPREASLTALERTDDWFKVDYHGAQGWISADYVETEGTCG